MVPISALLGLLFAQIGLTYALFRLAHGQIRLRLQAEGFRNELDMLHRVESARREANDREQWERSAREQESHRQEALKGRGEATEAGDSVVPTSPNAWERLTADDHT